ncbi:MAG: hypothetical protein HXY34_11780 [Candidatus Thorarchaeota archaeon]|nr:hypothetical protein [Candidatus Thorarchaeota archaeon]
MRISDIQAGQNVPEITVRVVSVSPPRIITTRGGRKTQLREVLVMDSSGATIVLSLWGFGSGDELKGGQIVKITDGWAKEWQGKIQLSLGRAGKVDVIPDDGSIPPISDLSKGR